MNMKTRNILIAAATLVVFACAKTNEQPEPEGVRITIHAYQEGAHTKTTVQDGGTQVYWEPSDEIKVFFKGTGSRFISQNTEAATVADFSGTLNILVGANEGASSTTKIFGLYPYRAGATSDGTSVTTTLPAEQTGRAGSFAKNTHISLAATNANSIDLGFYNVTGGLRFSLTQEGIKSVTFQGNNGETLAGKIKLAFEGGVPAVKEVSEGEIVLTLNAPGGGTFETGKWYYIEAIPGTLSKGFKMVFSKGNETAKLSSSSSVTINRGKYGSLADADEGLIFKETGGGGDEPDPSSVIQFADPIAKYACVEKFDTNGDGEVSYEEAAAATSLYGLFKDWNTVTHFDEIKYFTGVTSTDGVFTGLTMLESITVPDNITTLGTFQGCTALTSVVLPAALKSLPSSCFEGCSTITEVTLPTAISTIPDYCFRNCSSLESLDMPSTVTAVNQYALSGCSKLAGIDLPSGLKTIGDYAFQGCSSLAGVSFPSALTFIGQYAFDHCRSLTTVSLADGVSIGSSAFSVCIALASVILPSDLISIPSNCFSNCIGLTAITWPANLTTISSGAFSGCRFNNANSTLELPASVTTIGSGAFGYLHHIIILSTTAVSIQGDTFAFGYTFLYVPAGMVEMYKVRTNWSYYKDNILPIGDYPKEPSVGGTTADAVDLGLPSGLKWASWNLGASSPEEYGDYFAWGETEPKSNYEWSTYKWCDGDYNKLTKYCTKSSCWDSSEPMDNKNVPDPEDDAAHVDWGGSWRMPTYDEWTELRDNCTWTRTTKNGVNGRLVTSKTNSNSIFLPAAGCRIGYNLNGAGSVGYYGSSSLETGDPRYANDFYLSVEVMGLCFDRCYGHSVRPVCPN